MNIVHSLWTKPLIFGNAPAKMRTFTDVNIACYTASVLFAQRQDLYVNLYADGMGQELLSFLPYRERYVLTVPDSVPIDYWAAGKFFALKMMPLRDIHIDGDVFLIGAKKVNWAEILNKNADLVIQSVEDQGDKLTKYYSAAREIVNRYLPFFYPGTSANPSPAYNCGLVGFQSQKLKDEYISAYMYGLNMLSSKEVIKAVRSTPNCVMDLVLEQQWLYQLIENTFPKATVNNILGSGDAAYDKAERIGYTHLLGKYKENCIKEVLQTIEGMDKNIYKKCIDKMNSIK